MTPSYANSPVSEVVFGVHFEPVVGLLSPHYGLLWETFREHGFEKLQELPPVPPSPRPMDAGQTPAPALSRIWFVREDDQQLVQVQRDRLIFNWRKTAANERYPGFAVVFATFVGHLRRFQTFLRAFELGDVEPLEFELSSELFFEPEDAWNLDRIERAVAGTRRPRSGSCDLPSPRRGPWRCPDRPFGRDRARGCLHPDADPLARFHPRRTASRHLLQPTPGGYIPGESGLAG